MREEAARDAKSKIDEASDAGIQNRSWWEEIGDWFTDNWDSIVAACKIVVAVVGIVAMIIGGPILGAIVLIAALVVLADTLYKYSKGQASLWDVGLAALDCIPGMKGLTTLGGLAKGLKALGKTGLKGMAAGVKGLGPRLKGLGRQMKNLFTCGDPIDMATGQMVMSIEDFSLPGVLPWWSDAATEPESDPDAGSARVGRPVLISVCCSTTTASASSVPTGPCSITRSRNRASRCDRWWDPTGRSAGAVRRTPG